VSKLVDCVESESGESGENANRPGANPEPIEVMRYLVVYLDSRLTMQKRARVPLGLLPHNISFTYTFLISAPAVKYLRTLWSRTHACLGWSRLGILGSVSELL